MNLPVREAFVKLHGEKAVRVKTLSVRDAAPELTELKRVLERYKQKCRKSRAETEAAIASIALPGATETKTRKQPSTLFSRDGKPDEKLLPNQCT